MAEDAPQDVAQDLAFGCPGGARPPRHATTAAAAVFAKLELRSGRNWAAQWHLARAVGKRFRGRRAKCLYVELELIQSHMAQKPVLRGEVGCACVAREVSVERVSMFIPYGHYLTLSLYE